ncbi:protein serine/threonine phosphatase 2C [Neolentinus lepideus HHB14362 ss-1]|uniref:Protein phosphatase n=1 Tax=Neolentinus lepideus HHB14362 ss-1 TaxID=1314782 RepID=A0A165T6F0_9AGAM|nr:protein serine/threonine phosphatase 2C [Neolentinus lepideus HHB14362 ss-1]
MSACILGLKRTRLIQHKHSSWRTISTLLRPYRFHIGASWAGKPRDPRVKRVKSVFPPDSIILKWKDEQLARLHKFTWNKDPGEDFFYVQEMREQSGISFGVADGVGGWADSGVDPSLFSQALMFHAHRYSQHGWAGEPEIDPTQEYEEREQVEGWEMTPQECLGLSYDAVLRERSVLAGSSTACLINLNASSGVLRSASLGDSGFSIIRSSQVFYRQQPQTHFFNCPKQLTKLPSGSRRYSNSAVDQPDDAEVYETRLRDGDIVVVYTDGLSDNVFPSEIISICALVARQMEGQKSDDEQAQTMANQIVEYAKLCMHNKQRVSPFERAAAREEMYFRGGKIDDVTVIVALVREAA